MACLVDRRVVSSLFPPTNLPAVIWLEASLDTLKTFKTFKTFKLLIKSAVPNLQKNLQASLSRTSTVSCSWSYWPLGRYAIFDPCLASISSRLLVLNDQHPSGPLGLNPAEDARTPRSLQRLGVRRNRAMPKTADDASDSDGETVIASPVPYPKAKCEPVLSTLSSTPFSPPFTQLSRPPVLTAQLVLPGPSTNVAGAPCIIGCLCVAARVTAQCPDVLAHGPAATHAADGMRGRTRANGTKHPRCCYRGLRVVLRTPPLNAKQPLALAVVGHGRESDEAALYYARLIITQKSRRDDRLKVTVLGGFSSYENLCGPPRERIKSIAGAITVEIIPRSTLRGTPHQSLDYSEQGPGCVSPESSGLALGCQMSPPVRQSLMLVDNGPAFSFMNEFRVLAGLLMVRIPANSENCYSRVGETRCEGYGSVVFLRVIAAVICSNYKI
ncbi:hypothetical protein DFH07DRAFT_936493 [Mycena maculata]|uniref:Uncharacterized protein n=1 Tax=Mycena maculata TaxID=230809 RepID=A0AAD7NVN8_9AGAR|nr:hypothetical protein DFH07DRAFT_936493 [Mycena maculata]